MVAENHHHNHLGLLGLAVLVLKTKDFCNGTWSAYIQSAMRQGADMPIKTATLLCVVRRSRRRTSRIG